MTILAHPAFLRPRLRFPELRHILKLSSGPAVEPVSIEQFKSNAKIEYTDEDDLFRSWLKTAREMIERDVARGFITQTWKLYMDSFPEWEIQLQKCPVQTVTAIDYINTSGVSTTHDPTLYQFDTASEPGRLAPAYSQSWPATRSQLNAVIVTFTVGYGDAADNVPEDPKSAIKTLMTFWNRNRESAGQRPENYDSLIDSLRWGAYA